MQLSPTKSSPDVLKISAIISQLEGSLDVEVHTWKIQNLLEVSSELWGFLSALLMEPLEVSDWPMLEGGMPKICT